MTVVAVVSQKGGVGKTTVCLNLGYALARRGWRTLVVDADPQGSIGLSLKGGNRASGLVSFLSGETSLAGAVLTTRLQELDILPIGNDSAGDTWDRAEAITQAGALERFAERARADYELILVDTPAGLYGPTRQILGISDFAFVPLQAEPLALRSMTQVLDTIGRLREQGSKVALAGVLLTMVNSRNEVSLAVTQETWSVLPPKLVLDSFVPRDETILKASAHGVPIGLLGRRAPALAAVFEGIAAELEDRLGLVAETEEYDEPISLLD